MMLPSQKSYSHKGKNYQDCIQYYNNVSAGFAADDTFLSCLIKQLQRYMNTGSSQWRMQWLHLTARQQVAVRQELEHVEHKTPHLEHQ